MKIAHIVCTFPPYKGGMGNSAYHFAEILSSLGHEITVFTPDYKAGKPKVIGPKIGGLCDFEDVTDSKNSKSKINFKVVRLRPLFSHGNAAILPQLLWRLNGFDVVHLHYPFYGASLFVLLKKIFSGEKMKLAIHYHMDTVAKGAKGFVFELNRIFILPVLVRFSKVITCASLDYVKHSALAEFYKARPEKFRQTLFGVDSEKFHPSSDASVSKEKTILFVGGLDKAHYFKGLEILISALRKVAQMVDCSLIVIGGGDMRDFYEKRASEAGIAEKVKFAGVVPDDELPSYYERCDCLVLPSINEGEAFGLVLLEAMASGKPVIASNLPGVRGIFKPGREGLLAEPGNANDLAAKLKIILRDRDLAAKMGAAGRELVEKKYSWEKVGRRLDLIYHYAKYTPG